METISIGEIQEKSNQTGSECDMEDVSWRISVAKKVWGSDSNCSAFSQDGQIEQATIFRVPGNIRACDPEAYEPLVVALGPFRNDTYQCPYSIEAMQQHKWRCVRFLLSRHLNSHIATRKLHECLAAIKALEVQARRCYMYDPCLNLLSSDEFAEMLLLDGCFILHFLLKYSERSEIEVAAEREQLDMTIVPVNEDEFNLQRQEPDNNIMLVDSCSEDAEMQSVGGLWTWSFVKYDLIKLENQIPFFVITTLFDLLKTPRETNADPVSLALGFFQVFHPRRTKPLSSVPKEIHHLLHLYHQSLLPSVDQVTIPSSNGNNWIPSAMELRESGISFRRKMNAYSCLDITYAKGTIEIPKLHLCKYSSTAFRNLMALEQCFPVAPYVTNYTLFMDCILHRGAEDVRLLHRKEIIVNRQRSDEEAARFFNSLSKHIHHGYELNYLEDVFSEVIKYTEVPWNRWRAGLVREYFSSPWVIISLAAAVLLIILTLQQAFFSAYSYFYPPR